MTPDATPPSARRERKARLVRTALLDAGFAAFATHPLTLVSVFDITERADVAKGVFYLHFASKDDFLLELLREVHRRFHELLADLEESDTIAGLIAAYARFARTHSSETRYWIRSESYAPDEIGQPGDLAAIRAQHLSTLAGRLAPRPTVADRLDAGALHGACLGVLCTLGLEADLSSLLPRLAGGGGGRGRLTSSRRQRGRSASSRR